MKAKTTELLTTDEAAEMLGISAQTMRAYMCRNKTRDYYGVEPIKLPNRMLRWRREELEAKLLSNGLNSGAGCRRRNAAGRRSPGMKCSASSGEAAWTT